MLTALALVVFAQLTPAGPTGPVYSQASTGAAVPYDPGTLLFSLLGAGSTDQSAVADLCDTYAADMVGSYWCVRGDGTGTGTAMVAQGSPTTQTRSLCGNGMSCGNVTRQRLDGATQYFKTADVASPAGDFSTCWVGASIATSGTQVFVGRRLTTNVFFLNASPVTPSVSVYKASGAATTINNGTLAASARAAICVTYDYVADGTSILKLYVDGVETNSSSTAVGPPAPATKPWFIGTQDGSTSFVNGAFGNAFFTETVLSPATILAMANTALGNLTPATGQALTQTRTSGSSCYNAAESEITILPPNRLCVTGGEWGANPPTIHRTLQSEDFTTTWTAINSVAAAPVITANTTDTLDPKGFNTAEKVVFPTVSGPTDYSLIRQTFTGTAAGWSSLLHCKTASGTVSIYSALSISTPTYYQQLCTCTTTWQPCRLENKTLTAATWNRDIGVNLNDPGQASQTGGTVYLWGERSAAEQFASAYDQTTSAAVTRGAEIVRLASDPGFPLNKGCVGVTIRPNATGGTNQATYFMSLTGVTTLIPMYNNSPLGIQSFDGVHAVATFANFVSGTAKNYVTSWSLANNFLRTRNITDVDVAALGYTVPTGAVTSVNLGASNSSGANTARARLSKYVIYTGPDGCAQ